MTTTMSERLATNRKPRLRLSLRALMLAILLIALALGWVIQRAEVQRKAVADLERAGFSMIYRWGWSEARFDPSNKNPRWLQWWIDRLGPDYFRDVSILSTTRNPAPIVDDHLMAQIGRLSKLETIIFNSTEGVTDDRLALISNLTGLKALFVNADIHGAGLIHLQRIQNLQILKISSVTDREMPLIGQMKSLASLGLGVSPNLTDAGMVHLAGLANLQNLEIAGASRVTNSGLESLKNLRRLAYLDLNHCGVTSLEPIRPLRELITLQLDGCPVDDVGLAPVSGYNKLWLLSLSHTSVTKQGVGRLTSGMKKLNVSY